MPAAPLRERRIHGDPDADDQRSPFQRDRDRILYSRAFRRLAEVTQVVHAGESHTYHNRLTHSLKVAQVGRRLAEYQLKKVEDGEYEKDILDEIGGLDPDVVETAALAHDLGHPPFGHVAETELDDRTREKNVSGGFGGNAQSFRIVNHVATHSNADDFDGLDLTRASLNAMLKYPWRRGTAGKKAKKWGYYHSEEGEFEAAREIEPPTGERRCVEAEIMDWADDLAYAIHDLADFYRAGVIPLGELLRDTQERKDFVEEFDAEKGDELEGEWDAQEFLSNDIEKIATVAGTDRESVWNFLHSPFRNSKREKAALHFLTSSFVERYLGVSGDIDVSLDPSADGGLSVPDKCRNEVLLLRFMTEYYVFNHPTLVAQQEGHREIIGAVFETLYEAAEPDSSKAKVIPPPFDEEIEAINDQNGEREAERRRARVVADVIASMTEEQVVSLHNRISGESPGSIRDRIID